MRLVKIVVKLVVASAALLATPAWAEGALAVGCTADGTIVWGWQFGESSVEAAEPKALQRCQAHGSECILLRQALHGDGAWIAMAMNPVPEPRCSPFGVYYSASKETAEKTAMANCQKAGGQHCTVTFAAQNKGVTTYRIVPGTGQGLTSYRTKDPRCSSSGPMGSGAVTTGCW